MCRRMCVSRGLIVLAWPELPPRDLRERQEVWDVGEHVCLCVCMYTSLHIQWL